MKYFMLIWAGLWRKKTRTILTMLSIVIAFLLFGLLQGINQGMNNVYQNMNVERMYVQSRINMTDGLPIAYAQRIKTVPHVAAISHWTYFGGFYQEAKQALPVFATDIEALLKVYKEMKLPKDQLEAMLHTRNGAVIGKAIAEKYKWKVGDVVPVGTSIWTKKAGGNTWDFQIVGILDVSAYGEGTGFPSFYINWDYFDEARQFGNGVIHYYLLGLDDPRAGDQVAAQVDALFANSTNETKTQSEQAWAQAQIKQVGDVNFIVNSIVGAVLFTLLFLTANTMMQSVRERIPELAVLKTLGFSDSKVLVLVLLESVALCVFASLVGLGVATLGFGALRPLLGDVSLPLVVLELGIGIALALALISGLPPALRAKQLNIVDALAGR
jgi:putative ABC transport system permease protein